MTRETSAAMLFGVSIALVLLAASKGVPAADSDRAQTFVVHCYDEARDIVSRTLRKDCKGRIVSQAQAKAHRDRRMQDRLKRMLSPAPVDGSAEDVGHDGRAVPEKAPSTPAAEPVKPKPGGMPSTPRPVPKTAERSDTTVDDDDGTRHAQTTEEDERTPDDGEDGLADAAAPQQADTNMFRVKSTSAFGGRFPAQIVLPFAKGQRATLDELGIVDENGGPVVASLEPMTTWFADGSVRTARIVLVDEIEPRGTNRYRLIESERMPGIGLTESADTIEIDTGRLRFTVHKKRFNIVDKAWLDDKLVLDGSKGFTLTDHAGRQFADAARRDVRVYVEQHGPAEAVIVAQAPTIFHGLDEIEPGFKVRIHAYAGLDWVKIAYQMRNTAHGTGVPRRSMPLFFERAGIAFRVPGSKAAGRELLQMRPEDKRLRGIASIGDVTVFVPHFWERSPSKLAISGDMARVEFFPSEGAQHHDRKCRKKKGKRTCAFDYTPTHPSGLYWLWDMQAIIFETAIAFGDVDADALYDHLHWPLVPEVPVERYQSTKAIPTTFSGDLPLGPRRGDRRGRPYGDGFRSGQNQNYQLGWGSFWGQGTERRQASCTTGGVPSGGYRYIASNDTAHWYDVRLRAFADLNLRPQWGPQNYEFKKHFAKMQLGEPPYCGGSWRSIVEKNKEKHPKAMAGSFVQLVPGSYRDWAARDWSHGWHQYIDDVYYLTGSRWIEDWLKFLGQFVIGHINEFAKVKGKHHLGVRWVGTFDRQMGHMLAAAVMSWRAHRDAELERVLKYRFERLMRTNDNRYGYPAWGEGWGYMTGYLAYGLMQAYYDFQGVDDLTVGHIWNTLNAWVAANRYANFAYKHKFGKVGTKPSASRGEAQSAIDLQAWIYWHTGQQALWNQLERYRNKGLNGGKPAWSKQRSWNGGYLGRFAPVVERERRKRTDWQPPQPPQVDVSANGRVTWRASPDTVRVHIVCGPKPIAVNFTVDETKLNWWKARPVLPQGNTAKCKAGDHAAVFAFDEAGNMSGSAR